MATQERKRKVAAQTGLYLLVVTAIVVVANLLGAGAYKRIDTTKTERYTLSKGSARLVQELKQPVEIEAFVKTGQAQLDAFVRDLTDLLGEYERQSNGNLKYTIIEANTDELRQKAKDAGLQEQPFGEASATGEDQASITQGFMGLVFKYGSEKGVIPALQPNRGEGLEFWITNKIREIRDKNDNIKHRIGVITGKDELKLDDTNLVARQGQGQGGPSLKQIISQNFPFYSIEELDLKEGAEPIDTGFVGLIITQPRKDYTEKELRRIDEFLMQGNKSLAVFASAVTMKPNDATMSAELSLHGLDALLGGYGISMKKDAVMDHGAQFRIAVPTQGGIVWIRHPGIAHVVNDPRFDEDEKLLDTSFPGFFRMEEMMVPFPSSLELLRDKQPADVKLSVVARTTPNASAITGDSVDMKLREQWDVKPPLEQRAIAAVAEGKLKSAFAGKPDEAIKAPDVAKEPSRVFVLSSSQFLTNPFAFAGNGPELGGQFQMFGAVGGDRDLQMISQPYTKYLTGTILSLKNTLDWLSGDTDLIAASAKLLGEPNLTYSSVSKPTIKGNETDEQLRKLDEEYRLSRKGLQRKVQWSLTLGVPVLFAAYGLFRWRSRENKRGQKAA